MAALSNSHAPHRPYHPLPMPLRLPWQAPPVNKVKLIDLVNVMLFTSMNTVKGRQASMTSFSRL